MSDEIWNNALVKCAEMLERGAHVHEEAAAESDDEERVLTEAEVHRFQSEELLGFAAEIRALMRSGP